MLKGKGCIRTQDRYKSISAAEVWRRWEIAPSSIELKVRRLKLLQGAAAHPDDSKQMVSVLF
eukprot:4555366-Pyramimonas_sp.AAC.1